MRGMNSPNGQHPSIHLRWAGVNRRNRADTRQRVAVLAKLNVGAVAEGIQEKDSRFNPRASGR
jgi:hypothetical protein